MKLKENFKAVLNIWGATFKTLRENPNIIIPFLVVGFADILILALVYLTPRPPLSALLAPPIRAFWGEQFLHYPFNLFLIPKLFQYGHIISTAFIGVLMTGVAILMLKEAKGSLRPGILFNLIRALRMYLRLLVIWLVIFGLVSVVFKGLSFAFKLKQPLITLYISLFISIFIQTIFMYAMPAVMLEQKKAFSAMKRSISFCRNVFLLTLILVGIPTLFYIPLIMLQGGLAKLMSRFFPEIVLAIMGLNIIVSVITDCLVTCSTTILFLNKRKDE